MKILGEKNINKWKFKKCVKVLRVKMLMNLQRSNPEFNNSKVFLTNNKTAIKNNNLKNMFNNSWKINPD